MSEFKVTEPLIAKVASLAITGISNQTIAVRINEEEGTKYTHRNIGAVQRHERYGTYLEDMSASIVAKAKTQLRTKVSNIVDKVFKVIEDRLDAKDLKAIYPALKILGFDVTEDVKQATSITVQLPNIGPVEKSVDAFGGQGKPE